MPILAELGRFQFLRCIDFLAILFIAFYKSLIKYEVRRLEQFRVDMTVSGSKQKLIAKVCGAEK